MAVADADNAQHDDEEDHGGDAEVIYRARLAVGEVGPNPLNRMAK